MRTHMRTYMRTYSHPLLYRIYIIYRKISYLLAIATRFYIIFCENLFDI